MYNSLSKMNVQCHDIVPRRLANTRVHRVCVAAPPGKLWLNGVAGMATRRAPATGLTYVRYLCVYRSIDMCTHVCTVHGQSTVPRRSVRVSDCASCVFSTSRIFLELTITTARETLGTIPATLLVSSLGIR